MNTPTKGTPLTFSTREGKILSGKFSHMAPNGKAYIHGEDGKGYERPLDKIRIVGEAQTEFKVSIHKSSSKLAAITGDEDLENSWQEQSAPEEPTEQQKVMNSFDINHRFSFLESLTRMVINGSAVSLVVTGEGGLGKTYTVLDQLARKQLVENNQFVHIKGFATARGLYRLLFENSDKICVFDDCDAVLEDKVALNLLKGALDSYDKRMIKWIVKTPDESLPDEFEFTGRIVFISNMPMHKVSQAILSRAMSVDLTMSLDDKLIRMQNILPKLKPSVSLEMKQECLDLIKEYSKHCMDLNMRTLLKTIDIRIDSENEDWKSLAIYSITNTKS
jgi:hypothetical protein